MCAQRSRVYPRTNALGSAKTDCHTCSRLRENCDRQRPQCGPCLDRGRKCGGFELDIVWKNERQARPRRSPAAPSDVLRNDQHAPTGPFSEPIRFIHNGGKRRRKTGKLRADMARYMTTIPTVPDTPEEESTSLNDEYGTPVLSQEASSTTEELERLSDEDADGMLSTTPFLESSDQFDWDSLDVQSPGGGLDHELQLYDPFAVQDHGIWPNPFPLSPGPLYSSPTNKAAAILDMCECPF